MEIKLKYLMIENFKGCKKLIVNFAQLTDILGQNASGKTTILDAFMWLLFNKDSTGATSFQIRPLDANGNQIDYLEISVEGGLEIGGREVTLKKVQKQRWVKSRRTQIEELQGNENLFEISGYPKSEKDYKEYIASLIDEKMFRLLTDPRVFANMPWKEQRDILFKLVNSVSDLDIATADPQFAPLVPELEIATVDDIKAKYTKASNEWKKKQIELPARIDEVSKQIMDVDISELEIQRNSLKEQISEVEAKTEDSGKEFESYQQKSDEVFALRREIADYQGKANELCTKQRGFFQNTLNELSNSITDYERKISQNKQEIERLETGIKRNEQEKADLLNEWKSEKAKQFPEYVELTALDENSLLCPTCDQPLPEELKQKKISDYEIRKTAHKEKYDKDKKTFEEKKTSHLEEIVAAGNKKAADIEKDRGEISSLLNDVDALKKVVESLSTEKKEQEKRLSAIPAEADLSENNDYKEMQLRLSDMENALSNMNSGSDYRNQLKIQLSGLREELSICEKKIAAADNSKAEERKAELENELREVGQKVADQEQMIYLVEQFIRAKMNRISSSINAKFKTVDFKLFNNQINGGMTECCECTVNGVPYSTLNSGHKIIAGLDIINTLSQMYEVCAPIFIDNAESINSFNVPEMENQMILLKVSDDTELKVEGA